MAVRYTRRAGERLSERIKKKILEAVADGYERRDIARAYGISPTYVTLLVKTAKLKS